MFRSRSLRLPAPVLTSLAALSVVAGLAAGCGAGGEDAGSDAAPGSANAAPGAAEGTAEPSGGATSSTTSGARGSAASPAPRATEPSTATPTEVEYEGSGEWEYARETRRPDGTGAVFPVAIRVEKGLPIDLDETAAFVMGTLRDRRGWEKLDGVAFELVPDPDEASAVVSVSSPGTTDELCAGLTTNGYTSCRVGDVVAINANRWLGATPDFPDLTVYRQYVVNHEVGHAIGHDHEYCPGPGEPAPVMQKQTLGLQGCTANPWPAVA